ncbi:MAG: hypothetical protein N2049_04290 [Anaerolineales bacterium]|nr:hypothetical protein [Anaerolineales bacterium]MCX7608422.1 hypothetical protein [Anaerolineales bacterium]MDW8227077.1 hypothetical protein [Anaerolineales bacterium]
MPGRIAFSGLIVLFLIGLTACRASSPVSPTPTLPDVQAEEEAVYAALFEQTYNEPRMYVIQAETETHAMPQDLNTLLAYVQEGMASLQETTIENFKARNDTTYPLRPDMQLGRPYVLLTREEINQIFGLNTSGWDVFYTRYPNSPGLTRVSRVGFNSDYTQALVYIGTQSHWLAGAGYYVLLEKVEGQWKIIQEVMVWIS